MSLSHFEACVFVCWHSPMQTRNRAHVPIGSYSYSRPHYLAISASTSHRFDDNNLSLANLRFLVTFLPFSFMSPERSMRTNFSKKKRRRNRRKISISNLHMRHLQNWHKCHLYCEFAVCQSKVRFVFVQISDSLWRFNRVPFTIELNQNQ